MLGYLIVKSPSDIIIFDLMTGSGEFSNKLNNNLKYLSQSFELEGERDVLVKMY